jgi:hypothetical protein
MIFHRKERSKKKSQSQNNHFLLLSRPFFFVFAFMNSLNLAEAKRRRSPRRKKQSKTANKQRANTLTRPGSRAVFIESAHIVFFLTSPQMPQTRETQKSNFGYL